jgi:quinol monooxygenase YgiN
LQRTTNNKRSLITHITLDNKVTTLINVFVVANAEAQDQLIELLEEATEKVMKHLPGFISANIHRSLDGTHVVNYAQWSDKKSFENMLKNVEAKKHMEKAFELSQPTPHLYEIVSIYHA